MDAAAATDLAQAPDCISRSIAALDGLVLDDLSENRQAWCLKHPIGGSVATAERNRMKNAKACPKCQHNEIIRIPGTVRAFGAGNNIVVGGTIFSSVQVTRYLCAGCGFGEEWVDSIDDIARIKKKYAS